MEKQEGIEKDNMLTESISEAVKAQKTTLPPWVLAIGIIASVGGTFFKSQYAVEALEIKMNDQCIKVVQLEEKFNDQKNSYIRLDERIIGVQKELTEIKSLIKEYLAKN